MEKPQPFRLPIDGISVSATAYASSAPRRAITLILGHGAGAGQNSAFIVAFATGLAARGIDVVTFDFLYREQGRRLPDSNDRLEACYRAVIEGVRKERGINRNAFAIGGKSMGGRIASQVAAGAADLAGVVLLGYPLHPPGKPQQRRTKHLPHVTVPMLFVQGERDAFGTADELRSVVEGLPSAELYVIEQGDHSFTLPKRAGVAQQTVYAAIQDKIAAWLRTLAPRQE